MKKCIIHANCQAIPFIKLLTESQDFISTWTIKYIVNFAKEPLTDDMLADCDLFLYQNLGQDWGELASQKLLAKLPNHARSISIPNVVNFQFWPFAILPQKPYDLWLDKHVESLLEREDLSTTDIALLVMRTDFSKYYDLSALQEKSLSLEIKKAYAGNVNICNFVQENITKEPLFTTPNHPAYTLLLYITNTVLQELNIPKLNPTPTRTTHVCDGDFYLPIHPFFGKYYNIPYITAETRYPVYGNHLTYREYLLAYIDARKAKIPLFSYFDHLK